MSVLITGTKTLSYALQMLREFKDEPWIVQPIIELGYNNLIADSCLQALGEAMLKLNDESWDEAYPGHAGVEPTPFTFKADPEFRLDLMLGIKCLAFWLCNSDHDETDDLYKAIKTAHREIVWTKVVMLSKEYDVLPWGISER